MAARLSKLSLGGPSMVWLTDALFLLKQTSFMRAERLSSTFTELCDMEACLGAVMVHLPVHYCALPCLFVFWSHLVVAQEATWMVPVWKGW